MKMKSLKAQFIGAIAMVLVAAIAMGSSTYAWFAMNQEVNAKHMVVQAKAEAGLVIAPWTANNATAPAASAFNVDATAAVASVLQVYPTFTKDATSWYHNSSTASDNARAYAGNYLTATNNDSTSTFYYLMNKFDIKSTGAAQDVYVKAITVTPGNNETLGDFDKSLRVLLKHGSDTMIFAPQYNTAQTETAGKTRFDPALSEDIVATTILPDTAAAKILTGVTTAQTVEIYVYYSGEDLNCKSELIPADHFNTLTIDVTFTSVAPTT